MEFPVCTWCRACVDHEDHSQFLEDTGHPARCLVLYFLGLLLRILLLQTLGNRGSTAESTPPFYATTYSLYQELRDA